MTQIEGKIPTFRNCGPRLPFCRRYRVSDKVAHELQEIVVRIRKMDDLVAEVASASQEQSQGIEQVNKAVSEMDKVTQTNAAHAEESARAHRS